MKTKTLLIALAIINLTLVGVQAQVTVSSVTTNGLSEPYNIVVDANNNFYISDGANNRIVRVDASTQLQTTLAGIPTDAPGSDDGPAYRAHFNNPQGMILVTYNGVTGLLVADYGNHLIRFVRLSDGFVTTLAGQTSGGPAVDATGLNATFRYPIGLNQDASGNVFIVDFGNNAVRVMNLNDPNLGVTNVIISGTTLSRPTASAFVSPNQLWIADTGNQMVKLFTLTTPTAASLISTLGAYRTTGTTDSSFGPDARFNGPSGLLWLQGIGLLISDSLNNSIRIATNYTPFGVNNYKVTTFAGTPGQAGLVDGNALSAKLNSPVGLAIDSENNGFLVADLKNNAIRRIQVGPVLPPVPAPQIGWVDFTVPPAVIVSILRPGSSFVFNNDVVIAILDTDGTETHYTSGTTPNNPVNDTIPDPSSTVGATPPNYFDGMFPNQVPPSIILPQPDVTIKAIGFQSGRKSSSIVRTRVQFRTAGPSIQGDNAASFKLIEETTGAELWYTIDGTDPTNAPPSFGPIAGSQTGLNLSINAASNFTFKTIAFRGGYQPSEIVSREFSVTNFNANKISFGFSSGEASSDFVASPGQFFYAPVTLTILPGTPMYSLQFNVTVNNAGPNPGPAVTPGAFRFESFLEKPIPGTSPPEFERIPPLAFDSIPPYFDPPPASSIVTYDGRQFINMSFTNTSNNLLGVGWLERFGRTNLYITTSQDLIKYSQPHDTLFDELNSRVVLGGYAFQVPSNAVASQTYQIQIGRPSATSDGIGAPGSDIYIATPTNGSLGGGTINAIKNVSVGQRKYVAGDSAPFRWFNAGDFGNTNLDSSDVMQVFQSAIYSLNYPPAGSDFFDSMDSCGYAYINQGNGYLELDTNFVFSGTFANPLFDGNDTTINQIAFGDGVLDVCDIYVTFRRSLDPSLSWFRRFWTNGVRAADIVGNPPPVAQALRKLTLAVSPAVNFSSTDLQAAAGQTLQIPITAQVFGTYPLRVATLSLSVKPLDGSAPLTTPIQFTPNGALGQPTIVGSSGKGNYAATWLNSTIAGLAGNATLGTLTVQIPSTASSNSAYAIHFDHASASPNGLAAFPKKTRTGLVTLSDRSASSFQDAIPDSWRLRYFGSLNNLLSQANADADGDGVNNLAEYIAGTDPTDAASKFNVSPRSGAQSPNCVIHWPSVAGKHYVIERSTSMFSPSWLPVATNTGTGSDMEFSDTSGGNVRFYRVSVQ